MRRGARAQVVRGLALAAAFGCGGAHGAGEAGRWLRVDTPHFVVLTDLPRGRALDSARLCERLLSAFEQHGWETTGELPGRMNVVMFADPQDYRAYAGSEERGAYYTELLFEPWLVMPAPHRVTGHETLAHELVHGIAFQAMPEQPRWYAEGVASYFQSSLFLGDGSFVVGRVPEDFVRWLAQYGLVPPSRLLQGDPGPSTYAFYASAWALTHYLITRRPQEFADFQDRVARGEAAEQAFRAAFPGLDRDALDRALHDYVRAGDYVTFAAPVEEPAAQLTLRALSRSEERVLPLMLWQGCRGCGAAHAERADRELAQLLVEQPDQLEVNALALLRPTGDHATRLARAWALAKAHPDRALAWAVLLAVAATGGELLPERRPDSPSERLLALRPNDAIGVLLVASQAALRRDHARVRRLVQRARRLAPGSSTVLMLSASLLDAIGDCPALAEAVRGLEARDVPEATLAPYRERAARCGS